MLIKGRLKSAVGMESVIAYPFKGIPDSGGKVYQKVVNTQCQQKWSGLFSGKMFFESGDYYGDLSKKSKGTTFLLSLFVQ